MRFYKTLIIHALLVLMPAISFADADGGVVSNDGGMVCSIFVNETNNPLRLTVDNDSYLIEKGDSSKIIIKPSATKYHLLNGEISVFAGGVQLENGDFNVVSQNEIIPNGMNCVVFYSISVYN